MVRTCVLACVALSLAACGTSFVPDAGRDVFDLDAQHDASVDRVMDVGSIESGPVAHQCPRLRPPVSTRPLACNGSTALCDRRYNEVAYPTAHNAMSNADEHFYLPNQRHGITRALLDGVRGFMIDTHYCDGEAALAHQFCWLGHKPLSVGLCEFTQFLDTHPDEVVTLQIEPYVTDADTVAAFEESGLIDYVRFQPADSPYPTLRQMTTDNRRLMVFIEQGGGDPNWLMPLFTYSFDTPYSFTTAADFNCTLNRGSRSNVLFTMNHWLQNPASDPMWAQIANVNPLLLDRARQCMTETGHLPNFVAVDFYDIGDLFPTVNTLNGL